VSDPSTEALLDELQLVDAERLRRCESLGRVDAGGLRALVEQFVRLDRLGADLVEGVRGVDDLEQTEPDLMRGLADDLGRPAVLDRWGLSTTVGQIGNQQVELVPGPLIEHFAESLGREADPLRCHAGLAHTYGYLFSPIPTDYGRKRHRWSTQEAAHVLGIPGRWPLGAPRGVLSTITRVLEHVAPLDREPLQLDEDAQVAAIVDGELTISGSDEGTPWLSRTRIVRRDGLASISDGDELLLVYSLAVDDGPECYITAFPVSASYAKVVLSDTRPRLRFLSVL
jgi:hypothetical protein